MAVKAFTSEWASAYKQAGKGWKWTVGLVVEAEPDKNFPQATGVFMDLFEGEAREIRIVSPEEAKACNFAITASYSRWKDVATEKLDATRGMLQGKLKLKGDLPTIVRYTKAAQELTKATTRVPVEWPDEKVT